MNEDQLRALVRQIVAERMAAGARSEPAPSPFLEPRMHSSHGVLRMAPSVEKGQPCVIEPHVACGHCGFCQSLGH
jgi:threonine dehydrogenase-like Zn-dependent dehydrogenase